VVRVGCHSAIVLRLSYQTHFVKWVRIRLKSLLCDLQRGVEADDTVGAGEPSILASEVSAITDQQARGYEGEI
jgi:hypothetical protein